jgi:hypothetical protein
MARVKQMPAAWLVTPFILLFFWLALNSMVWDSPTMDEQNHLARGLAFLRTGDPRLSLEHPPLVNSISTLPLLTLPDVQLPLDDPSWERQPPDVYWYWFADKLLWEYNHDVTRMIFLARLPIVFLTLGLALTGFHFAREAWGRWAALAAFLLLLFEPNILANGRYTTTDLGGTFFLFLAVYLLWRMWRIGDWSWRHWLVAALGLGLAFGSKLSTLIFVPILMITAVLPLYDIRPPATRDKPSPELVEGKGGSSRLSFHLPGWARRLVQFITAGLLSILVVWAIFGFEWGPFWFSEGPLMSLNQFSGPMPTFWAGIAKIVDLGSGGRASFLNGQFSTDGFLAYFPVAFVVKTPLVILLLLPLAAVVLLWREETRKTAVFFLIPSALYFLFSIPSGLNIGYRHLLPMLPFLLVLISGLAEKQKDEGGRTKDENHHASRITQYAVWIGITVLFVGTLWIHPHYLSYFNLLAGGPNGGRDILVDSNVDWGQDLLRLRQWQVENGVEDLKLGYFGTADPAYYGLEFEPLPGFPRPEFYIGLWDNPPFDTAAPEPGVYAISASSLWESHEENKMVFPWFRDQKPSEQIGYSILVYVVE